MSEESTCNSGDTGSTPGSEDPLKEGLATQSSAHAWRLLWTEEPGGLQSMGSQSRTRLKQLSTHTGLCRSLSHDLGQHRSYGLKRNSIHIFPKIRRNGRFCRLQRGCNDDWCLHGLDWLRCASHMDHTNLHEGGQAAGTVPFSVEVAEEQKE